MFSTLVHGLLPALLVLWGGADPTPEPVFVTATVRERPVSTATAAVTLIDRQTIEASGAQTLGELLRLTPGLFVETDGTRGGFSVARLRGGDPNFSNVQINGVPVNDLTYQAGGAFNLSGLSLEGVDRIEVVRGPLSSFYGSTGLAGVVNIITAPAAADRLRVRVTGGDGGYGAVGLVHSGELGQGHYTVGFSGERDKERIADERFESSGVFADLSLPLGAAELRLNARVGDWEADDYPDASGGPVYGSPQTRVSTHQEWQWGGQLSFGQNWRHQLDLGWYRHNLDRLSPGVFPSVPPADEDTQFTKTRLSWTAVRAWSSDWELGLGLDSIREEGDNQSLLLLPPEFGGNVVGDYHLDRAVHGAFAEVRRRHGDLLLELALRVDEPDDVDTEFSPRLGLRYQGWHASVGRAFKLPGFFATAGPRALGGNPNLEPETATGADLGWSYAQAGRRLDVTVFANRFKSLVDFDFDQFLHINRSEVEAVGVEVSGVWSRGPLRVQAALTGQDVSDPNSDVPLRHRPKWSGSVLASVQALKTLRLNLDGYGRSRANDQQLPVTHRFETSGYAVFGLGADWDVTRAWQLRGRVVNVTDRDYQTLIGFPGAARWFSLGLRYRR